MEENKTEKLLQKLSENISQHLQQMREYNRKHPKRWSIVRLFMKQKFYDRLS